MIDCTYKVTDFISPIPMSEADKYHFNKTFKKFFDSKSHNFPIKRQTAPKTLENRKT